MKRKQGTVEYTGRALQQDAHEAMRGDIIRGLIELITNVDDQLLDSKGKILVEVEHRRGSDWKLIVRDRASGMTADEMQERICKLAARTSGFEKGKAVRGQLGRGVKDLVAFGPVTFEAIKGGRYARMTLQPSGEYLFEEDTKAKPEHREAIGVTRGDGMSVTVNASSRIRCPRHQRLVDQLAKHYQLRDIMSDPRREVILVNLNNGESDVVRYSHPSLPIVFSEEVTIEGYPDAVANVTILRNAERYDDAASDPYRPAGLLLKGARATYDNTLFRYESRPQAGWFSGRVECPYIDVLARDYDDRASSGKPSDEKNPFPIVTRRRAGLQTEHPFYAALCAAVEAPLGRLIEEQEQKAREGGARESARLRRSLDALGRDLTRLMSEDLRDIDEELDAGGGDGAVPTVRIVPEQAVLYMGENKTLTVHVQKSLGAVTATAEADPEGVVELIDGNEIELKPHERRPDLLIGRVRVRPMLEEKETLLAVTAAGETSYALLEVEPERAEEEVEVVSPDTLSFERDSYRVAWTKRRAIRIVAPAETVSEHGKKVKVTSSDPGVVVLDGGLVDMRLDDELEYYVGSVTIHTRILGAKAELRATVGTASCTATVVVARDQGGPKLQIEFRDEGAGSRRAIVERSGEGMLILIMGQHVAARRFLGPGPKFEFQDLCASRTLVAEIVANEVTRVVMERKYPTGGDVDAARLYADHAKYLSKYLARCQKLLVPEGSLKRATGG